MKLLTGVLLIFMLAQIMFAKGYYDNWGVEFETGTQEKTDILTETLNDYYDYYKNNLFIKFLDTESQAKISFKLESGFKDYVDDSLDNRFHLLNVDYTDQLSKLFWFDCSAKAGPVIAETNKDASYNLYNLAPKISAKFDTFELSGAVIFQEKSYKKDNNISSRALNFGIKKQFNQESSLNLDCGIKEITQSSDDNSDRKNTKYAKIGYYWQR